MNVIKKVGVCEMSAVRQCLTKECESGPARQKSASFKVCFVYFSFSNILTRFFNNNINGGSFPPSKKEKQK
jgi:hypothetical protein